MPRLAQPAGSEDAREPVALLGNLVKVSILRVLRATPDVTIGSICAELELGPRCSRTSSARMRRVL